MIVAVEVGVALSRPPRTDRLSRVLVDVELSDFSTAAFDAAERDARLTACYIADRPDVVMVVSAEVVGIVEI